MDKIKLLSVCRRRPKAASSASWAAVVENYAPDRYELLSSAGERDTLKKVEQFHPEIVLILPSILHGDLSDGVGLLREIKRLSPESAVLVHIGNVDDEQAAVDAFMAAGAYKCYLPPVVMDTLFHDMYVALNLE